MDYASYYNGKQFKDLTPDELKELRKAYARTHAINCLIGKKSLTDAERKARRAVRYKRYYDNMTTKQKRARVAKEKLRRWEQR